MSAELFEACKTGDVGSAQACLARGVNVNARQHGRKTPLMNAVIYKRIDILRILLARDDLDIAATACGGYTALHWACMMGSPDYVALLGKDRRMTSNIINIKNSRGYTPLMCAAGSNRLSCVEKMTELDGVDWETKDKYGESLEDVTRRMEYMGLLKYVRKVKAAEDSPVQLKKMKLSKLSQVLENLENKMEAEEIALDVKHKKKEETLETKCARRRESLENELREEMSAMHELNVKEKENLSNENKKQKELLESEIIARVSGSPSLPPAPECPICLDSLAPPARLYNCPEGHLFCSECRTKVDVCHLCRKPLQGRASAMEQYLRAVYGQD